MDLSALVTQLLPTTQNKQTIQDLLPTQQTNRSYPDTKPIQQTKLNITASLFSACERNGEWILWYNLEWPGFMPLNQRQATEQQLRNFYDYFVELKSYPGEEKYYKLKSIDKKDMKIIFDADLWIRENLLGVKQTFSPPLSLLYKSRKTLPTLAYITAGTGELSKFLCDRFQTYLKNKSQLLKHREFGFLKKVGIELFDYSFSFRDMTYRATLKFSVILASLAAYMIWKYQKDLSKKEIDSLQKKASNMKDVKGLDKYIKRL